jgi:chemotaxis protein CheD
MTKSAVTALANKWREHRIHVVQGDYHVSADKGAVLTTILGSCVAACMRDPLAGVAGMNHFLLPGEAGDASMRYGVQSMELLVNGLLRLGAARDRLECKLFGGARLMANLSDIGEMNVAFAEAFLKNEGIAYLGGSVGGVKARRVEYWLGSGRARQFLVDAGQVAEQIRPAPPPPAAGAVELF